MTTEPVTKLSLTTLEDVIRRGDRLTSVTAYDYPSARLADAAGIDIVLVGDSAAMAMLGYDSTLPISVDEMITFTRAVARGVRRAIVVADMPFGSFQVSDEAAVANAVRFAREGGADAVKIEGAGASLSRARAIVDAGVPVMGHIGLTPQSVTKLGGYRAQGRTADAAQELVEDAKALESAGCFAIVLEAMPAVVAAHISAALSIPTIGIGAGPECGGQVLVWHDLLGLTPGHVAKFVKSYAQLGATIEQALRAYIADVRGGVFPGPEHTYRMAPDERDRFEHLDHLPTATRKD
jgi:3-methyl-2-oxobutanoate hydroxymethyltransferase